MQPFRSEIINTPTQPTIKIFLTDSSLDKNVKTYLEQHFNSIDKIEIRQSVARNRADENLTVFLKDTTDISKIKKAIESSLWDYFEVGLS